MESGDEIRHDSQKTDYSMVGINAIIVIMVLIVYSGRFDILQVLIFGKYDNFFIHKKGLKKNCVEY